MPCNTYKKGNYSKTLFYKIYDTDLYDIRPSREMEFEYIPCREAYSHRMTQWNGIENRAYFAAIVYLNQNVDDGSVSPDDVKEVKAALSRYEDLCKRVDVLEKPPPANVKKIRGDSESHEYLENSIRFNAVEHLK